MQEEKNKLPPEREEKLSGDGRMHSPFLRWAENIWYHYKWQLLVGLLALVVLCVTLVQCTASGKGDDAYVLTAGGYALNTVGRRDLENTLKGFTEDRNGDERTVVAIGSYPIYTDAEIAKQPKENQAYFKQLSYDNRQNFDQEILAGEATLCFLSPALFEEVAEAKGLLPLAEYATVPSGAEAVQYGGVAYGLRLSSLAIAGYPGISALPEDTVLCVRERTSMNMLFGKKEAEALYNANLALVGRLLAAAPYVAE